MGGVIACVCSRETDYLQDLTYAGLSEVLGKEKVLDIPRHGSYHHERKFFFGPKFSYPRNLGFVKGRPPDRPADINLVILASAKPDALGAFAELSEKVRAPWVFIDGGDLSEIGGDFKRTGGAAAFELFQNLCRRQPPAAIFKRELLQGIEAEGVFPFPFSFKMHGELNILSPKKYDVVFWAVESSETRKKAFQILSGRYDCGINGSVAGQKFRSFALKGKNYFEGMAAAKVALSFRGAGFDTLRYWEIPACGALLISEAPSIQIPDNFRYGENAIFCKPDLSDLTQKIDYFLVHEKEREGIAAAGRRHLLAYHTHTARAEYFIEKVKEKLGLDLRR